jgi:MYXO-CTERM domain-containing protein
VDQSGSAPGSFLELDVDGGTGDPIPLVRQRFDAWRAANPCPTTGTPPPPTTTSCGCHMTPSGSAAPLLALLALLLRRRRG